MAVALEGFLADAFDFHQVGGALESPAALPVENDLAGGRGPDVPQNLQLLRGRGVDVDGLGLNF